MAEPTEARWLLLIHQIPPKPDYLRVKVWRRLQRPGATAVKNSAYILPRSEQAQEDLQWVAREIAEGGGEASTCEARFVVHGADRIDQSRGASALEGEQRGSDGGDCVGRPGRLSCGSRTT